MAVRDGKILYIGSEAEAERQLSPHAKVLELRGATVLPAFIDAHIHPIDSGVEFAECYLYDANTLNDLLNTVRKCVASSQSGWLRGSGWAQTLFESVPLSENPLDFIETTGPIALMSSDGHSYWVNHVALENAGITARTPDPRDGVIGRKTGSREPNGFLLEGAMNFIDRLIPRRTLDDQKRGLAKALSMMRENGITSFHDAYVTEDHLRIYADFIAANRIPGLIATAMYADSNLPVESQITEFRRLRTKYSSPHLRVGTIKIFLDGTIEDHTAALLKPYLYVRTRDGRSTPGRLQWSIGKLNRIVELGERSGFQFHFHAIGDDAVRAALNAIERSKRINHTRNLRHQIAHIELVAPNDILRFAKLGVIANFQPLWAVRDDFIEKLAAPYLGSQRSKWIYPIGAFSRSGVTLAFGSDWSVTSLDPRAGIETAVRRTNPGDRLDDAWTPEQRISVREALAGYTTGAAYANFWENTTGALRSGLRADFIVVDRSPLEIPHNELATLKIQATYSDGIQVYPEVTREP
jgi:predicted amidohydrolase YtcJ